MNSITSLQWWLCLTFLLTGLLLASPADAQFIRADANADGMVDIADGVGVLSYLFIPGTPPVDCLDALDTDDNGLVDLSDAVQIFAYLFSSGPEPAAPFPVEGADPTADALGDCGGGAGTPLDFSILEEGDQSGVPSPCEVELLTFAIRTQMEWELFWSTHITIFPGPALPAVDFVEESVIVVMQSASTGGWGVEVTAVTEFSDHVEVDVEVTDPEGCFTLFICSAPHQILVVPALTTDGDVTANVVTDFPCL